MRRLPGEKKREDVAFWCGYGRSSAGSLSKLNEARQMKRLGKSARSGS
jgi:hypothetical protein